MLHWSNWANRSLLGGSIKSALCTRNSSAWFRASILIFLTHCSNRGLNPDSWSTSRFFHQSSRQKIREDVSMLTKRTRQPHMVLLHPMIHRSDLVWQRCRININHRSFWSEKQREAMRFRLSKWHGGLISRRGDKRTVKHAYRRRRATSSPKQELHTYTQAHSVGGQWIAHNWKHQYSMPINGFNASLVG